jgi:hypothetical protein
VHCRGETDHLPSKPQAPVSTNVTVPHHTSEPGQPTPFRNPFVDAAVLTWESPAGVGVSPFAAPVKARARCARHPGGVAQPLFLCNFFHAFPEPREQLLITGVSCTEATVSTR